MTTDTYHSRVLLVLFAAAVLTAGLLALVETTPARAADRSFEAAPNSPLSVGSTPTTVTNVDFNADGEMDLAAQNYGSNTVSVLLGNGDGTFQSKQDFAVGSSPSAVISKDFNSDEIPDLAVTNLSSNSVSVLLGQDLNSDSKGDGTFTQKQDFAVGFHPTSVISADFNGDSYADLAVANYSDNNVSVLLGQDSNGDNKADGTFRAKQDFSIATRTCNDFICAWDTAAPNQIISADFNGDNKADLATANLGSSIFNATGPGSVSVLLGKGDGTFQTYRLVKTNATNSSVTSIAAVHINASGSLDLVATEYNSNVVSMLRGNGDGSFQTGQNLPVGSNPSAVTSADLDGDTKADDLAISNYGSNNVSVLFNNDNGSFQAAQNFPAGSGPAFVVGADFNTDSFTDLTVANQNSNNVSVLLNTEPPPPPPETTISSGPSEGQVVNSTSATFGFTSSEPGSTFQCSLDDPNDSAYSPCTSPQTVPEEGSLAEGSHTFYVKAIGASGTDPTPATRTWKVDATAPTINNVSPPDQSQNVSLGTDIETTFSETMNASTLTTSTFMLTKQGSSTPVAGTVIHSSTTNKATLNPSSNLASNTTYTATIKGGSTGVKDSAGNALAQDHSWTFTTGAPPDTTAPRVSAATPTGTGVARGTNAVATFSERMDPTTITTSTFKLFRCSSTTSTNCATQVTNVGVSLSTDRLKATLNPFGTSSTLLAGRTKFKVVVTTGAKDEAGLNLDQDAGTSGRQQKVWYFTTGRS